MYNDSKPKSNIQPMSEKCETRSAFVAETIQPRCPTPARETGDVEQQLLRLNNNVNEVEKIFSELFEKVYPILLPENNPCGEKDCALEKTVSPLASDIRTINQKIDLIKSRMIDTIIRIQL